MKQANSKLQHHHIKAITNGSHEMCRSRAGHLLSRLRYETKYRSLLAAGCILMMALSIHFQEIPSARNSKNNHASLGFPSDPLEVASLFQVLPGKGCNGTAASYSLKQMFLEAAYILDDRIAHDYDFVKDGVAMFNNAFVQGERPPAVFDCEVVYVPISCMSQEASKMSFDVNQTESNIQRHNVVILDTAVMIYQYWGDAYYHAMVEDLPRLTYVLEYLKQNPSASILAGPKYLIDDGRNKVINQVLGLERNHTWVPYDPKKSYFVKNLLVPTGTPCGHAQPKCVGQIQAAVEINLSIMLQEAEARSGFMSTQQVNKTKQIILVHNRQGSRRKVVNHAELMKALRTEFASCCEVVEFLGTESLDECIAMHHAADVIIGPHGAGLANVIFSRREQPPVGMVEFHPQYGNWRNQKVNRCHQHTAAVAGLEPRMLVQNDSTQFGHFSVEVPPVLAAVRELLALRSR